MTREIGIPASPDASLDGPTNQKSDIISELEGLPKLLKTMWEAEGQEAKKLFDSFAACYPDLKSNLCNQTVILDLLKKANILQIIRYAKKLNPDQKDTYQSQMSDLSDQLTRHHAQTVAQEAEFVVLKGTLLDQYLEAATALTKEIFQLRGRNFPSERSFAFTVRSQLAPLLHQMGLIKQKAKEQIVETATTY